MYIFPRDPVRREVWAANVKRRGFQPANSSFLCEEHFEADQFRTSARGKRKLKPDAIPTIFAHSTPTVKPKRKPPSNRNHAQEMRELLVRSVKFDHGYAASGTGSQKGGLPTKGTETIPKESTLYVPLDMESDAGKEDEVEVKALDHNLHVQDLRLRELEGQLSVKDVHVALLQQKLLEAEQYAAKRSRDTESLYTNALKFLGPDQMTLALTGSMRGHTWTDQTIKKALQLRCVCGAKGYETLLKQGYPLPAVRTLQKDGPRLEQS